MGDSEITMDPTQKQDQTPPQQESSLGREYVGLAGVIAIMVYLVLFAAADLYVLVEIWPPVPTRSVAQTTEARPPSTSSTSPSTSGPEATRAAGAAPVTASPSQSTSPSSAGDTQKPAATSPTTTPTAATGANQKQTSTSEQDQGSWPVKFLWWRECPITLNSALFLIVMLCGAMGALVHASRSFYVYTGNRMLKWSWVAMYALLPFVGALLATVFYLIVRGGLSSTVNITSAYGYAAVGALVGLFTEQAVLQLKQIAEKVLAKPEPGKPGEGKDTATLTAAPPPKISGLSPTTGPATGGTAVTIKGDNFRQEAKVNFGGTAATVGVITAGSIAVTTPAHTAGAVDVEVINPDGKNDVLRGGFTYQ